MPIFPLFMETTAFSMVSPEMVWAVAPTRKMGWDCFGGVGVRSWAVVVVVRSAIEAAMSVGMSFIVGLVVFSVCFDVFGEKITGETPVPRVIVFGLVVGVPCGVGLVAVVVF